MSAIFISYTHHHLKEVEQLEKLFTDSGYTVLRDRSIINNGESIPDEIVEMIEDAHYFLLCHSRHTQKAPWVNWECGIASERARFGKLEMKIIRLDSSNPSTFNTLKRYDDLDSLFAQKSAEKQREVLQQILKNRKKFWVLKGSIKIVIASFSMALLFFTGQHLVQSNDYETYSTEWTSRSEIRDAVDSVANKDMTLFIKDVRTFHGQLVVDVSCQTNACDIDFYLNNMTNVQFTNGQSIPLKEVHLYGNIIPLTARSIIVGETLKQDHSVEMRWIFGMDKSLSIQDIDLIELTYRTGKYGFNRSLKLEFTRSNL